MASISSLLRSAEATRKKIRSQQEAVAAFEWENSAQTYEDFLQYSKFLETQRGQTNDVSEILTYETKLRSARRSFTSNEIQRAQMAIMEGRGDTKTKMDTIQELFYQANDNGDFNLAQNLMSQWEALSIKLQNEREAGARAAASSSEKEFTNLERKLTKGQDDITLPGGEKVTPLAVIARDLEENGGDNATWEAAADTLEALRGVVIDRYQNATTQEQVDKLEEKYGAGLQDIDKELYFSVGGKRLGLQQVMNAAANEQLNNPVYSLKAVRNETTGKNEFRLTENNVDQLDYIRQIDENGEEFYVPATVRTSQDSLFFGQSDQGRGVATQVTDEGQVIGDEGQVNRGLFDTASVERDSAQSIKNRLASLGIEAKQNGTTLTIKLPGESVERTATIQPDGSIRFYDDEGKLIEFGVTKRNLGTDTLPQIFEPGQMREVSPEEVSDFGTASAFGGQLSQASRQGERYVADITGRVAAPQSPIRGPIRVGNDFSGRGTGLTVAGLQGSTSALLQSAGAVRLQIQEEQTRKAMLQAQREAAERLQASATFNLNQTPIQQLTSQGILKRQLRVAAPTPQPRVRVVSAPTQRISGVTVAQPQGRVTVGRPAAQPRLVVR